MVPGGFPVRLMFTCALPIVPPNETPLPLVPPEVDTVNVCEPEEGRIRVPNRKLVGLWNCSVAAAAMPVKALTPRMQAQISRMVLTTALDRLEVHNSNTDIALVRIGQRYRGGRIDIGIVVSGI